MNHREHHHQHLKANSFCKLVGLEGQISPELTYEVVNGNHGDGGTPSRSLYSPRLGQPVA